MGYRLADWVGVGDSYVDGDADGDGDGDGLAEGLGLSVGGVLVGRAVGAERVMVGEKEGTVGVVVAEPAEQAERAAKPSMVKAPQPTAVGRTLSTVRATVGRTFIEPPDGSGRRRIYFPTPAAQTGPGRENARLAQSLPGPGDGGSPKAPTGQNGKTHGRPRQAMACSALEY